MNRIIQSHLRDFSKSYGLEAEDEAVQFEKFSNYAILCSKIPSGFDLDDVTTLNDDDGMDGLAVIINEELVTSDEDAELIFSSDRRNNEVEAIFIQAKRSASFDLGDYLKFKESVLRFITQEPYLAVSDIQKDDRKVFDTVINNVPKIRNGKPRVSIYYVTTGTYSYPDALETARNDTKNKLQELGLFDDVSVSFLGREEVLKLWVASYSEIEASLPMHASASLPDIAGIEESYLVVAKSTDYVNKLLTETDGTIRSQLFEENVRHYLGINNSVNAKIRETIESDSGHTRFPVLNNGITIVSPDVRVQGNTLHLRNFQIVNGCQTSHVLFDSKGSLTDDMMVTLKVVETTDEDVFSELVRATNSQSKVEENQFLSLSPLLKSVESYFNTFDGEEGRLYFERRDRQYVGKGIPAIRIVSLHNAAKCVGAMYLRRPELSYRYRKQMYKDLGPKIFSEGTKEILFYSSALALYRFYLLVSNSTIPQNMKRFKWHILPLVASMISGRGVPNLNSRSIEGYAQKIVDIFSSHNEQGTKVFTDAVAIIESMGSITNDRLKRQAVLNELLDKADSSRS